MKDLFIVLRNLRIFSKVIVLISLCYPLVNSADDAYANVVGSDFQTFNPTTNGVDFVTVQSAQTLRPGILNLGLFANYAVNAIPEFLDKEPHNYPRGTVRNTGVFSDANIGIGLTNFLDFGLSFPAILSQSIKEENERLQYDAVGVNEFRLNTKIKFFGNARHGIGTVGTINADRIENNPYSGNPASPIYTGELVGHSSIGNARMGVNIGYRKKSPGEKFEDSVADPFGDQLIGSVATSYLFSSLDSKVILEFYGSEPANRQKTSSEILQRSGEVLFGLKHDVTSKLALHAGATIGVIESPATPDWRLYLGINWNAGPLWSSEKIKDRVNHQKTARKPKAKQLPPSPAPTAVPMAPEQTVAEEEPRETIVLDNILFATDSSSQVIEGALSELKELVDYISSQPTWSVLAVDGHTDSVGDAAYNLSLSQKRAEAIKRYLVKQFNVPPTKIVARGFGEGVPIADNDNYQGRQLNRRVEIKIFD